MKIKSLFAKPLVKDIVTSTCLIGASAGVIFGVSAGMFKIEYMTLHGAEARLAAFENNSYVSENIPSSWNMNEGKTADGKVIPAFEAPTWKDMRAEFKQGTAEAKTWWSRIHGGLPAETSEHLWDDYETLEMSKPEGAWLSDATYTERYNYASIVIDGATHTTMDRSFNQSLYQGLVDFIHNERCDHCDPETGKDPKTEYIAKAWKPSQDNTTDFINTYISAIRQNGVLGLAGFNHSTPLSTMMTHKDLDGGGVDPLASNADSEVNKMCNETAFILLDSNIANNQNIASVQFRADQPGFLSGLATCQYLINNLDMYHDKFQDLAVAAFGGVPIPTVIDYIGGFQRGIEFFNYKVIMSSLETGRELYFGKEEYTNGDPAYIKARGETFNSLLEHSKYKEEIEAIKNDESLPTPDEKIAKYDELEYGVKLFEEFSIKMIKLGDFSTHFSGTFAAGDAIGITKQYLNRGASAIIAVAGPQSLDASQEIRNQKSKAIVIGVDTAMEDGDYQRYHAGCDESTKLNQNKNDPFMDKTVSPEDGSYSEQSNAIIKFSAIKDLRNVSNKITRLCAEGKNWDVSAKFGDKELNYPDEKRAVCGPGFQTCGNILNGLISISWDGFYFVLQALNHVDFIIPSDTGLERSDLAKTWEHSAKQYLIIADKEGQEISEEYKTGVKNIKNLFTFKRTKENGQPTAYYENYNHTMGILGYMFDDKGIRVEFDKSMSLVPVDVEDPRPTEFKIMDGDSTTMTILEWLNFNMYMMC